jgi:hypothetical protein
MPGLEPGMMLFAFPLPLWERVAERTQVREAG